ncbi:MAG: bifunctional aspartate kinase/homoserine dehydrogenase I [Paludibacteraceae bacterium]|nr:bifunctional aspartate kinase/homoserine dehydrogenase I [Paludibacteraceae bacterium]
MKVLKFGGTSVCSVSNILQIKKIIDKVDEPVIIVVSAVGGITDKLINTAKKAAIGDKEYLTGLNEIITIHHQLIDSVIKGSDKSTVMGRVNQYLDELSNIYKGVYLIKDLSTKTHDVVVSYGERISSYFLSYALDATLFDPLEFIKTENSLSKRAVDNITTTQLVKEAFANLPHRSIVGGFIASCNKTNEITNLGRGGSDYTAAMIAAALDARKLEIWTDVDGFLTADPRLVPNAYTILEMSYLEAMELSNFGAKVVYPPTIYPVYAKNIPVYIKNTNNPEVKGTKITSKNTNGDKTIKGISSIQQTSLITIQGMGMVGVLGISSRTFKSLADAGINVFFISQASSENSTTFAVTDKDAQAAVDVLQLEFEKELKNGNIEKIVPEKNLATIAIVGENMKSNTGIAGKLFNTLGRSGINIIACAQGASETNISFVVNMSNLKKSLNVIHDSFFLSDYQALNIFLVGTGTVGGSLLEQIHQQQEKLLEQNSVKINVVGITELNGTLFNPQGIELSNYAEQILKEGTTLSPAEVCSAIIEMNLFNSVFVDCTASPAIAELYEKLLNHNISVVAANKIAASSEYERYIHLKSLARKKGIKYLFETNVGAGLPIINTINNLINSGDKILKIEAVLSGTLNFIFNTISKDISFSQSIQLAKEARYAEPDPRVDLSGKDVIRKLVILARESGYHVEQEDVVKNLFVPEKYFEGSVDDFWNTIGELDAQFEEKRQALAAQDKKYRFVAKMENGKCEVGLKEVDVRHPFYDLEGSNNIITIHTERYLEYPMIIKGYGAGASVTAAGVFGDIISIANIR